MWMIPALWLDEDPLPVPPDVFGTTAFWRWWSARVLAQRRQA